MSRITRTHTTAAGATARTATIPTFYPETNHARAAPHTFNRHPEVKHTRAALHQSTAVVVVAVATIVVVAVAVAVVAGVVAVVVAVARTAAIPVLSGRKHT